ncbi:MAG: hypothetical protein HON53_19890 [Planctomycetaceae bacterium]|jgi:hypothetical protein|nr:hypothetical protein [Planctomycetaceae bacterium]
MSGLAACLLTASVFAQSPAAVGVVRISDRPRRSYAPSRQVRQTSLTRGQQVVNAGPAYAATWQPEANPIRRTSLNRFITATNNWLASPAFGSGYSSCQQGCADQGCSSCQQEASCQECSSCDQGCSDGSCGSCGGNAVGRSLDKVDRLLDDYFAFEHKCKRCLFGYFMPDGCCGQGCAPKGHYNLLYSANPNHFDQRDGRVYAAQGYGVPMAVPLAPNVRHTYNYGHGIPSSRLTPISTGAPF